MGKKIDTAGMWTYEGNPITRAGVFLYSGKAIDGNGSLGLDPQKLYPVLRPYEELLKAAESFNGKPIINDHEMIGTVEELTKPDEKNIGGTIYNVRPSQDQEGLIIADMTIFSDEIQQLVSSGKRELSCGYWCKYRPEVGTYNGQRYEFVQYDLEGNHIALVDNGRMGSGVRVFDAKEKTLVFDSMEMPKMKNKKQTLDADELRKEIDDSALLALVGRVGAAAPKRLSKLDTSCYICSRIDHNFSRMLSNAALLWTEEETFRAKVQKQPYICLPHFRMWLETAKNEMKKGYPDFYKEVSKPVYDYFDTLREDVSWFCKKFDYRYEKEDWGNSKDSVERARKFLCADLHKNVK
jgi:hypothetical protein